MYVCLCVSFYIFADCVGRAGMILLWNVIAPNATNYTVYDLPSLLFITIITIVILQMYVCTYIVRWCLYSMCL